MSESAELSVHPWSVVEDQLDLDHLPQTETVFALCNGHIGLRGNLDEGEPHAEAGTYLNGVFESMPLPYAEAGYGYPEEGQSVINITNGKLLRLLVDDEPLDVRHGQVLRHRRELDLRAGLLHRELEWVSPAGQGVRVRTTRLVSFVQRSVAAIRYEVEPFGEPARIVVQSTLVANEPVPERGDDPRAASALRAPLVSEYHTHNGMRVSMGHHTSRSGLSVAAGADHVVEGPHDTITASESEPDLARVTVSTELDPGETLTVYKFIAYGWSSTRSMPALRDQVDAALSAAKRSGWTGLVDAQRAYLDAFWNDADIEIDGAERLQQAVRYALFQVLQSAARAEQRAIPAKGLTGRGYDGHSFWDMESYVLPVLTYTMPHVARDALRWRHSILPLARDRARELRLAGAAFPWRTIRGEECSGYWPAGTAAFHINADIADAVRRYVAATGDTEFESCCGIDLLVETARLWSSLGHHDPEGRFRIDGVTGPDEYSALVDNNVFTNLMAERNLRAAADVAIRYPERAVELGVQPSEIEDWCRAADAIVVPFDAELGVTQQSAAFTRYRGWDFEKTTPDQYPLMLNFPYYLLYSSQVVKQADLVLALFFCGDRFSAAQKRRDFDYYERITVRDSSLSSCVQGVVAAEVGHLELAYDYLRETAYVDLQNLAGNTSSGVHLASLAGAWSTAVCGFGGMRDHGDTLSFAPRLTSKLNFIRFRMVYRGRSLKVTVRQDSALYELVSGEPLKLLHHGVAFTLEPGIPQTLSYPVRVEPPPVSPPPGRAPREYGIGSF